MHLVKNVHKVERDQRLLIGKSHAILRAKYLAESGLVFTLRSATGHIAFRLKSGYPRWVIPETQSCKSFCNGRDRRFFVPSHKQRF